MTSVPAGGRTVRLSGVADHCVLGGDNPKDVTVVAGETVTVAFSIVCGPATGSLNLQVVTTGDDIDPDGYLVMTSDPPLRIASNGATMIAGLPAGEIAIQLFDIAGNCAFVEGPTVVTVPPAGVVQVDYTLTCLGRLPNDIAFAAAALYPDPQDIFVVNANGAGLRNLTLSAEADLFPAWSPDGSRIAFARASGFPAQLFVIDANGSNATDLNVNINVQQSAWSRDGTRLAVTNNIDVFILNSDGTGLTNITNRICSPGAECGTAEDPTWSPDGIHIAYSQSFGILGPPRSCFTINRDGTENTLVKESCANPAWSPDGTTIAFAVIGSRPDNLAGHILSMKPDGSETVDLSLVAGSSGTDQYPAWSPDGGQLAFVSNRGVAEDPDRTGPKVFVMNADGSGVRHVTLSSEFEVVGRPTWSPRLR